MTVFALLLFIDQLSKYLIRHFSGFYICNPNIALSIKIPGIFFWFFWVAIIALLLFFSKKYPLPVSLILAGAIGNMTDRLFFGCVIDFIKMPFFPIFNLADIFITIGVILIIFSGFRKK